MHKDFFRKYMLACDKGFYPARGDGNYPPGVALVGENDTINVRYCYFYSDLRIICMHYYVLIYSDP